MSVSVCLSVCVCVCLFAITSTERYIRSPPNFSCILPTVVARFFLWRRSDMLCTSGFMDDVIFAHKARLLDVAAQLKRSAHAALGTAINRAQVAGRRTHTGLLFGRLK